MTCATSDPSHPICLPLHGNLLAYGDAEHHLRAVADDNEAEWAALFEDGEESHRRFLMIGREDADRFMVAAGDENRRIARGGFQLVGRDGRDEITLGSDGDHAAFDSSWHKKAHYLEKCVVQGVRTAAL